MIKNIFKMLVANLIKNMRKLNFGEGNQNLNYGLYK